MEEARKHFFEDFYAPSVRDTLAAKRRTIEKMLELQGLGPLPPTVAKIHALGVALKYGRYRSAAGYLSQYRVDCERHGFEFDQLMQRAVRDSIRSCVRGLGGPVQALPLPFDRLRMLPGGREPWVPSGPLAPRNLMVLGSWFMMREIEASHTLAKHVVVRLDGLGKPRVEWCLPVSKTDQEAVGAIRVHGCSCTTVVDPSCPGHAAWDHLTFLKAEFGVGPKGDRRLPEELPMFPSSDGRACTKEAVTATIEKAANLLRIDLATADGSARISGHSLRVTGAQGLAHLGLDLWAIQLLGRWGSSKVQLYVRDAHLQSAAAWASRASRRTSLEEVLAKIGGPRRAEAPIDEIIEESSAAAAAFVAESSREAAVQTDLADPLSHEILASRVGAAPPEAAGLDVVISATGLAHLVLVGPPDVELARSMTRCGWRFGFSGASLVSHSSLPPSHKAMCARCFAESRVAAKALLVDAARSVGASGASPACDPEPRTH